MLGCGERLFAQGYFFQGARTRGMLTAFCVIGMLSCFGANTVAQSPSTHPVAKNALATNEKSVPIVDDADKGDLNKLDLAKTELGKAKAMLPTQSSGSAAAPVVPRQGEHPLMPVLQWAEQGLPAIEKLQDYSATMVKREQLRGKVGAYEYMFLKVRHSPLSIYAKFLSPNSVKGQEVIYVEGKNQGNMLAHTAHSPVMVSIRPDGMIAMSDQRYPLTEIGVVNLVKRLVEVGQEDVRHDECEVKYFTDVLLNKRHCTVIQVVHPKQRDIFRFHLARIFVDDELMIPIRYESYAWPKTPGDSPELLEEYTYLDLKLNNGFTDEDFSDHNPEYHFQRPGDSNAASEGNLAR
jgi:hypothetical protein